jgi:uncharacterized Rmd1/YagE family protein
MLEVLRDHQNNEHMSRLEWIVIILIGLAVSVAGVRGGNRFVLALQRITCVV